MGTGGRVTNWVRQISALGIANHPLPAPAEPPPRRRPAAVFASSPVIPPPPRFDNIRYHNRRPRFLQDSLHFRPLPPFRRPSPTPRPSPPAACASGWRDGSAPALRPHRLNMPAAVTPLPSPRPGSPLVSASGGRSGAPTPSQAEALPLDPSFSGSPLGGVLQDSILLFTTVCGINARARVWPGAGLCRLFAILTAAGAVFLWGSVFPLPRHLAGLLGLPVAFLCFRRISEGIPRRRESLPDVLTISAASGVPRLPVEMAQAVRRGEKSAQKKKEHRRFPVPSLALSLFCCPGQAVTAWPLVP